jgi:mRNA-degrading endonuclease RelE of RelBE toxin-antitoxin system
MKYQIAKRFKKDLDKINHKKMLAKVRKCIEAIGTSQSLSEIRDLEALKGFSGYYRIKFDYNYRIGIFWDGEVIELLKIESREGFYKNFP